MLSIVEECSEIYSPSYFLRYKLKDEGENGCSCIKRNVCRLAQENLSATYEKQHQAIQNSCYHKTQKCLLIS